MTILHTCRRAAIATVVVFALVLGTAGCDGDGDAKGAAGATTTTRRPDPTYDYGYDIYVTDTGPQPKTLVALAEKDVVFHNETGEAVSLVFVNIDDPTPRTIEAGGELTYDVPGSESVAYEVGNPPVPGTIQGLDREPKDGPAQ